VVSPASMPVPSAITHWEIVIFILYNRLDDESMETMGDEMPRALYCSATRMLLRVHDLWFPLGKTSS